MAKCSYDMCPLPDNNNRFLFQLAYTVVGVLVLLSKPENFTFFQTMLFTMPILMDVVCSGPQNRAALIMRWAIGFLDSLILLACLLGMGGIIVENDIGFFFPENMMVVGGLGVSKGAIGIILIANLIVPVSYYTWSPCKKTAGIKRAVERKKVS